MEPNQVDFLIIGATGFTGKVYVSRILIKLPNYCVVCDEVSRFSNCSEGRLV